VTPHRTPDPAAELAALRAEVAALRAVIDGRDAAAIAAIVERHRLATPGPYAFESTGDGTWGIGVVDPHPPSGEVVADYDEAARRWRRSPDVVEALATNGPDGTLADGRFLAHAWEDIATLLAHIAALRALVPAEGARS